MPQVALVGGAHIHTPNFVKKLAETEHIVTRYVWDPDRRIAEARQDVTGGDVVGDVDTIWADKSVDAVVICSQTDLHEELVLAAARAGKHMFVEKPLGMDGTDAWQMAKAINDADVIFQTGYFMRGNPQIQYLRQLLQEGTLGRITRYRLSNCHSGSLRGLFDTDWRWMADPDRAGCGAFGDLGTHALDLLLWLTEDDAVESCTGHVDVAAARYGNQCDEFGEGMLRFRSGAIATLAGGWVDVANPNSLEISGTEGHARITHGELFLTTSNLPDADGKSPWTTDLPDAWPHAFDLFLQAINGDDNVPLVRADEAALRSSIMTAIYQAAEQQTWVTPKVG
ncbi:Gfo/Idh/MocA family protein [Phycisphaerales bacterium AB-hyl4]|uniref:Gfo/Idh/MocA family protein n=1 Tax=Natronomicrosphaera hydrolytica TaxID=3242702 RepID=A0ABV4U284_9BACT